MGLSWDDGGYSAAVEIYLLTGDQKLAVSQIGPDSLILRDAAQVHNGHAQIVIIVDGREEIHDVIISAEHSATELAFA